MLPPGFTDRLRPLYGNPKFRSLFLLNVLHGVSTAFVMPFMSMFGTIEVGMSLFTFGVFMTLNAVAAIVVSTGLAHFSDTHFSRRTMLLVGSVSGALGYVGYAYFRSLPALLAVGMVLGAIGTITFSQVFAYAREVVLRSGVLPSQAALYINVFRMFIALAWTVGPAIAAVVMLRYSFRGLFACAAGALFLFAAVVWRVVEPAPPPAARSALHAIPLSKVLARVDLLAHFVAFALITASTTIGMMDLPLLILKTLHGTESNIGTTYCVAPVFELPFMLYFGWLATKHAPARIIRVGMIISLVYYALLTCVTAPWQVYLCQGLSAAATSVISGVAITYFQGYLPDRPGTATNLYTSAQRIGSTAGYALFVGLAWRFGYRAVFEACALFAVAALGLMLVPVRVVREGALAG